MSSPARSVKLGIPLVFTFERGYSRLQHRISIHDDILHGGMNREIRLHPTPTKSFRQQGCRAWYNPSGLSAGQVERQRLSGTASSRLTDDQSPFGLFEGYGHVFAG